MHRAVMHIFPVDGVGAGGGNIPQQIQTDPKKGKDAAEFAKDNQNTVQKVSVFSNYDTDKNENVNFKEANSNSLFARQDISQLKPNLDNYNIPDAGIKQRFETQITKLALSKFDPAKKFEAALKSFNVKVEATSVNQTKDNGEDNTQAINNAARELDNTVRTEAANVSKTANETMMQGYMQAMREAQEQFMSDQNSAEGLNISDDEMNSKINGTKQADAKEGAENTKTKTTVHSSYDIQPKDGNITYNEMKDTHFAFNDTTSMSGDAATKKAVSEHFGEGYAQKLFENEVSKFSAKIGTVDIDSADNKDISKKITKATQELNQKAEKAAIKANNAANTKVNAEYQKQLDKATAQQIAGGKIADDVKTQIEDKKPEETQQRDLKNGEVRSKYDNNKDGYATNRDSDVMAKFNSNTPTTGLNADGFEKEVIDSAGKTFANQREDIIKTATSGFSENAIDKASSADSIDQKIEAAISGKTSAINDALQAAYTKALNDAKAAAGKAKPADNTGGAGSTDSASESEQVSDSSGGSGKTYTIKPGDTLSKLAKIGNTTVEKLIEANKDKPDSGVRNKDLIIAGKKLYLPAGVTIPDTPTGSGRKSTPAKTNQQAKSSETTPTTPNITSPLEMNGRSDIITMRANQHKSLIESKKTSSPEMLMAYTTLDNYIKGNKNITMKTAEKALDKLLQNENNMRNFGQGRSV